MLLVNSEGGGWIEKLSKQHFLERDNIENLIKLWGW